MITQLRLLVFLLALPLLTLSQVEKLDLDIIDKIKNEGLNNSKVMETAFQLTDVNGPRLTNSTGFKKAINYVKGQLANWGLKNVRTESFGEFGKGWDLQRSYVAMTDPYYKPFIALPRAWTNGTSGLT